MKNKLLNCLTAIAVAAALAAVVAMIFLPRSARADRTDTWSASSVSVYKVDLKRLPDGGCSVRACATMTKQDGGTTSECTRNPTEVGGANRTTCLDIINNKAPALFKTDKGL